MGDDPYVVDNGGGGAEVYSMPPKYTWMLIDFNQTKYRHGFGNTLSPCKILNIYV